MTKQQQALRNVFDKSPHSNINIILQCLSSTTTSTCHARQAHAHILKSGLSNHANLTTKLLSLYANNHCFHEASLILDSVSDPNVFTFSTLIHAYSKLSRFADALRLFSRMISHARLLPDAHVFPSVFKACAGLRAFKLGQQKACTSMYGQFYYNNWNTDLDMKIFGQMLKSTVNKNIAIT
nr:pentatricopeptide repeat-containing protein [Quercus suber]